MSNVPVVFITDDNYVLPTVVAIQSLINHYQGESVLDIYVIADRVGKKGTHCLKELSGEKVHVETLMIDGSNISKFDVKGYYISSSAMLKLSIARLLPDYDEVLFLDGDILVQEDISPLCEIDLDGYYAAAVADMAGMEALHFHKEIKHMRYFNSGVMLLNLKRFRDEDLEQKGFAVKEKHPEYPCMEQHVLNVLFHDEVKYLPPKWNLMTYNFIKFNLSLARTCAFYQVDYASFADMEKDACIIHLTNEVKPWTHRHAYKSDEWLAVKAESPAEDWDLHLKTNPDGAYMQFVKMMGETYHEVDAALTELEGQIASNGQEGQGAPMSSIESVQQYAGDARFRFPYEAVKPGSVIVIYGGGVVGKTFLAQLGQSSYCHVAAVCDANPHGTGIVSLPVISLAELSGWEAERYDMVLIALERRDVAKDVYENLKMAGIPTEKIRYLDPARR